MLLVTALLKPRDCCPCVTMGCSESVGSFDGTTCGRTSLTSSPFIRFEWQDNVRTDLSAQQIRSCTPPDGAYGCYCCRARLCILLFWCHPCLYWCARESSSGRDVEYKLQLHQPPNESQDWRAECGTNHCTSSTWSSFAPTCQRSNFARR